MKKGREKRVWFQWKICLSPPTTTPQTHPSAGNRVFPDYNVQVRILVILINPRPLRHGVHLTSSPLHKAGCHSHNADPRAPGGVGHVSC
jgi:hypothetical protein